MVTSSEFSVKYSGPALEKHAMDVDDLGPALLAIGRLCRESSRVLLNTQSGIAVNVKATGEGSFDIVLQLTHQAIGAAKSLFQEDVSIPDRVIAALGLAGGSYGLLQFLIRKKGRKITEQKAETDGDGNKLYNIKIDGDNNYITINEDTYKVSQDIRVRKAQREVLEPLASGAITSFQSNDAEISQNDVVDGHFDVILEEVNLSEQPIPPHKSPLLL